MTYTHLSALRGELARQKLDGFVVPRADEHLGEDVPPRRRAPRLADRFHRQRRAGGGAGRQGGGVHGWPLRAAACRADRPGLVGPLPRDRGAAAHLAGRQRASRRPDRLRSAADGRGRPGPLHRCRPDHGAGGGQSGGRGLDRPAAAARCPRRAASAVVRRALGGGQTGGHRQGPASRRNRMRRC